MSGKYDKLSRISRNISNAAETLINLHESLEKTLEAIEDLNDYQEDLEYEISCLDEEEG